MPRWISIVFLVAACAGEPSPDALCNHVLAVARRSGVVATSAQADDEAAECIAFQKTFKDQLGGDLYRKVTSCYMSKNDLTGMMNDCNPDRLSGGSGPQVASAEDYVRKSKTAEARVRLANMHARALQIAADTDGFPARSAGPIPPLGTCCKEGGTCQPRLEYWDGSPWRELYFAMDDPHLYSYEYTVDKSGTAFTVRAYGDLDCDGTYSTFSMTGQLGQSAPTGRHEPEAVAPLE